MLKALLDVGATQADALTDDARSLVCGQLLTPLTTYTRWSDTFAIDNGGFTQFDEAAFAALLKREIEHVGKCLFVAVPDVVGAARRTLEIWFHWRRYVPDPWPRAFVCQDGAENHAIPWEGATAIFIGGTTDWKMSSEAAAIIKAAKILGKHVHVGRVNTPKRWNHFDKLGVDTCDGSGISRFDWMLNSIATRNDHPLLDSVTA